MPKRVEDSRLVHVIYEREAYGMGMVFDQAGSFRGVLPAKSTDRLRRTRSRQGVYAETRYRLLDPKQKRAFEEPWETRAIENFSRYFSRVFREGSPLVESDEIFGRYLSEVIDSPSPTDRILDLGSGRGRYSAYFQNRIVSIDLDVPPTRPKLEGSAFADRVVGSAQTLPFRDASFSFVLCLFVLEHLASPFPVLGEICRVLQPGGRVILAFPSSGILEALRARYLGHRLTLPIHHLRSFGLIPHQFIESTRKVVSYLRKGGCREIRVKAISANSPDSNWSSRLLNSRFPFNHMGQQTIVVGIKATSC